MTTAEPTVVETTDTDETTYEAPPTEASFVLVAQTAGDQVKLDYTDGMTVREALEKAGITVREGQMPIVNGRPGSLDDVITDPRTAISVAGKTANG